MASLDRKLGASCWDYLNNIITKAPEHKNSGAYYFVEIKKGLSRASRIGMPLRAQPLVVAVENKYFIAIHTLNLIKIVNI